MSVVEKPSAQFCIIFTKFREDRSKTEAVTVLQIYRKCWRTYEIKAAKSLKAIVDDNWFL